MALPGESGGESYKFLDRNDAIQKLIEARNSAATADYSNGNDITEQVMPVICGPVYPDAVQVLSYKDHNPANAKGVYPFVYFHQVKGADPLGRENWHGAGHQLMRINPDNGETYIDDLFRTVYHFRDTQFHPMLAPLQDSIAEETPQFQAILDQLQAKADEEARAKAEKERLEALKEARREFIATQPREAMRQILTEVGAPDEIVEGSLTKEQIEELLSVAHVVSSKITGGSLDACEEGEIADQILGEAMRMDHDGTNISSDHHNAYYLREFAKQPAMRATSAEEFWDKVAKYAEWHELNPSQVSSMYDSWKHNHIERTKREWALGVLGGQEAAAEYIPEGFLSISAAPRGATIAYEDVDTLVSDMWNYFVPRAHNFLSGVAAADAITRAVDDSPHTHDALARLNELTGGDTAELTRLETEIRDWDASGEPVYRDSMDEGYGDPYKYSGGMLTGHGISIQRDRRYHLGLGGRGYGVNPNNPAYLAENFAIVSGREIDYYPAVSVTYKSDYATPNEVTEVTNGSSSWQVGDTVVDYRSLATGLNTLFGGRIDDVPELARALGEARPIHSNTFRLGDIADAGFQKLVANEAFNPQTLQATGTNLVSKNYGHEGETAPQEFSFDLREIPGRSSTFKELMHKAIAASILNSQNY